MSNIERTKLHSGTLARIIAPPDRGPTRLPRSNLILSLTRPPIASKHRADSPASALSSSIPAARRQCAPPLLVPLLPNFGSPAQPTSQLAAKAPRRPNILSSSLPPLLYLGARLQPTTVSVPCIVSSARRRAPASHELLCLLAPACASYPSVPSRTPPLAVQRHPEHVPDRSAAPPRPASSAPRSGRKRKKQIVTLLRSGIGG